MMGRMARPDNESSMTGLKGSSVSMIKVASSSNPVRAWGR